MDWTWFRRHWRLGLGAVAVGFVLLIAATAQLTGVAAFERHRGYFAPAWSADGRQVYFLQRDTAGFVWGLGWEFFSPPASTYVLSDRFSLNRLDPADGTIETLERFDGGPLTGRLTQHYRGRIFNPVSARIEPATDGVEFAVRMNIPRIPASEQWSLVGTWWPGRPSGASWSGDWAGAMTTSDAVLRDGVELMTVPGRESFPAAIVAVEADGGHRVLVRNSDFDALYPNGVAPTVIADRSHRARIERVRELARVRGELVEGYLADGLTEGEALLRAADELEERGFFPKRPRLVAIAAEAPPADLPVFDIPGERFEVGLFQDIAAAIAAPGEAVETGTGTYLKYEDDETGLELKAWRADGNDRFAVRTDGRVFVMEVRRDGE